MKVNMLVLGVAVALSALADVQYVAHQGEEKLAPNHTKEAYQFAADHKLDYLKLDIRETKDGVIVLQHDDSLKAVYGTNLVELSSSPPRLSQCHHLHARRGP